MKSSRLLSGIAAAILLALAGNARAGTLTIDNGPSFMPGSSFIDNNITAVLQTNPPGVMGDVVRLFGDSMVAPGTPPPSILLGGSFSAHAGDLFSVIYGFTVNLNTTTPITLTLGAQTIVAGVPQTFSTLITLNPGFQYYHGQISGPLFSLATSGLWNGYLVFNFSASGDPEHPLPGNLNLQLKAVDYQLAAIPEPSSLVLLGMGSAALLAFALRRRRLA